MLYYKGPDAKLHHGVQCVYLCRYVSSIHASNFPRTDSFVRNVPGEITSEHYIVIVLPYPVGGFVILSNQPRFFPKRWYGEMHTVPDLIDALG